MLTLLPTALLALSTPSKLPLANTINSVGTLSPHDKLLRVTAADVAAASGVDLNDARSQLSDLAAIAGSMEVSQTGQLVYAFPRNVARKAARQDAARPALISKAQRGAQACIGLLLIASVAVVRPLIARGSDAQRVSLRQELRTLLDGGDSSSESLALACYAFLLGDGAGRERSQAEQLEAQYAAIARAIRTNKGAVSSAQLLPFLVERPTGSTAIENADAYDRGDGTSSSSTWLHPVEDWMVPILSRFDGRPVVTDDGDLVYLFPEMLTTTKRDAKYGLYPTTAPIVKSASDVLRSLQGPKGGVDNRDYLEEPYAPFMRREGAGKVLAVAFANWGAVVLLGALLGPWQVALRQMGRTSALYAVNALYGALLVNGFAWLALPATRRVNLWVENYKVKRRNRRRQKDAARLLVGRALLLERDGGRRLAKSLQAASELRAKGRRHEVNLGVSEAAVYTTAKSLLEQAAEAGDPIGEAWERELDRRTRR